MHLDLKGAPPKLSYLLELVPWLKRAGASGVVLEYEDTFPFAQRLAPLASPAAYSLDDLRTFCNACAKNGLDVFPLIQTFGHAEFILKHGEFSTLREDINFPNCFCPFNPGTLEVVGEMLRQVLGFHSDASIIHIGCDEVWHLGSCASCRSAMAKQGWCKVDLFMWFVKEVVGIVKAIRPDIRVLIWDDEMRNCGTEAIGKFELGQLVEPVVWYYGANGCPDVWDAYSSAFPSIWCASAFKGASGCSETVPDLHRHVENHKLWLAIMEEQKGRVAKWGGIILTGWSRYDHFGILCELLPAGLPSLALNLAILNHEGFNETSHKEASEFLGLIQLIPVTSKSRPSDVLEQCSFPGNKIFVCSQWQANALARMEAFLASPLYKGWYVEFNLRRGRANKGTLRQIGGQASLIADDFDDLAESSRGALLEVYGKDVAEEWIESHNRPYKNTLEEVIAKICTAVDIL